MQITSAQNQITKLSSYVRISITTLKNNHPTLLTMVTNTQCENVGKLAAGNSITTINVG